MFPPEAEATEWLILFRRDAFLLIIRNICFVMQNHKINFVMQESILFVLCLSVLRQNGEPDYVWF